MDRSGDGEEVIMDKVFNCLTVPARELSFRSFTQELFTGMCVLAGCDFLSSVPGIGIKRAHALVSKYKNIDRVLSVLQLDKKRHIPEGYVNSFKEANAVFHHARVYDADMRCLSFLKPLPEGFSQAFDDNLDFLGPELPSSMVIAIAEGRLDPVTMEAFDEFPKIPSSPGHRVVYGNETVILQNQSRESKTKKEGGPFILLSEKTQAEFCMQTGEEPLPELTYTAERKKVNKTELEVSEGVPEIDCFLSRQKACELDRGLMTHFRAIAEHSSLTRSSLHMDDNQMNNNGVALDVKGQKRVFPPTPANNPFKRTKLEDQSVSLAQSLGTSLPQGASKTDSADAHLSELSKKSQGNKITAAEARLESILQKSESSLTKDSNKPHFVIPAGNEQELLSTINNLACSGAALRSDTSIPLSDGPSSPQVIQRTVPAPTTQPYMHRVNTKSIATPMSSSPSRGIHGKRTSSSTKPKTGTKGNKAGNASENPATNNSGILKFFTKM